MDTITATSSTPAYKHPAFSSLKYIKIPTKCRATEGKSHNPNINFINFVNFNNFISVTIHDTYILKVLATFTTHLIHIIWNILKSLIILDFKVVSEGKFWKYVYSTHNIKPKHGLLQRAHPKAANNCKWDHIKLKFLCYMHQHFKFFVIIGLMMAFWGWNKQSIMENNKINIKLYQTEYIYNLFFNEVC